MWNLLSWDATVPLPRDRATALTFCGETTRHPHPKSEQTSLPESLPNGFQRKFEHFSAKMVSILALPSPFQLPSLTATNFFPMKKIAFALLASTLCLSAQSAPAQEAG